MKMLKKNWLPLVCAVLFTGFISCEGPEGPAGPAGPAGAAGADGQNGADGQDGADGMDGTAMVTSIVTDLSAEFDVEALEFPTPEITQDVIDNGVVLGYVSVDDVWYPLPAIPDDALLFFHISFSFTVGEAYLEFWDDPSLAEFYILEEGDLTSFRLVIIEGSDTSSQSSILDDLNSNGVDVNSYKEVADFYNLN